MTSIRDAKRRREDIPPLAAHLLPGHDLFAVLQGFHKTKMRCMAGEQAMAFE
jgi:hypothetical protein